MSLTASPVARSALPSASRNAKTSSAEGRAAAGPVEGCPAEGAEALAGCAPASPGDGARRADGRLDGRRLCSLAPYQTAGCLLELPATRTAVAVEAEAGVCGPGSTSASSGWAMTQAGFLIFSMMNGGTEDMRTPAIITST